MKTTSVSNRVPAPFLMTIMIVLGAVISAQAEVPQTVIQNPDIGYQAAAMGASVAQDAGTVAAGAPDSNNHRGSVRIFVELEQGAWEQQAELTASDAADEDLFGGAVAVSGDTVVAGAPQAGGAHENSGAAYVFTRTAGVWHEQAKLEADDGAADDSFGKSVAIFGDTALVGAPWADAGGLTNNGAVYVFTRSADAWVQQQKLTAPDGANDALLGICVSLYGDTALAGASGATIGGDTQCGAAYVFTGAGSSWALEQKLVSSDKSAFDNFGNSAAIYNDVAIIGAAGQDIGGNSNAGAAYIFVRSGSAWAQQAKLTASDAAGEDAFGCSVSIHGDLAMAGAYMEDGAGTNRGAAYVFSASGGVWTERAKLAASDSADDYSFGASVSIDGDAALAGSPWRVHETSTGAVYVYQPFETAWNEKAILIPSPAVNDAFGMDVALSGDIAIVGAPSDNSAGADAGAAYVFVRSSGAWTEEARLTASDIAPYDEFGSAVDIDGDTAVFGVSGRDDGGNESGAAYIFVRTGETWAQQAKLTASDAGAGDEFGISVAISGDTVVVGAHADDDGAANSGSAYVFTRSGDAWTQQAKLTASEAHASDYFGGGVAVEGDTAVIGAMNDDDLGVNSGAAYVFARSGGIWVQQAKLTPDHNGDQIYFGGVLSISGDTLAAGAYLDGSYGAVYLFTDSEGVWNQEAKLQASDADVNGAFGYRVALSGNLAVVGDFWDDDHGEDSGAAYVFARSEGAWVEKAKLSAADAAPNDWFGSSVDIDGGLALISAVKKDGPETDSGEAHSFEAAHTLTFQTDGTSGASIEGEATQLVIHGDDSSPVTAAAPAGWHFEKWTLGGSDYSDQNPLTINAVSEDLSLVAHYAINEYTLIYHAGALGSLSGELVQTVLAGADGSVVTATPDPGAVFIRWSDGNPEAVRQDLGVASDLEVTALFGLLIDDIVELQRIGVDSGYPLDGNYRMDADIDASGETGYIPIGSADVPFTGLFDGNGFAITGLRLYSGESSNNGLFRIIGVNGIVEDLNLLEVDIPIGGENTGALCGQNLGVIDNCHVTGSVCIESYSPFRGGLAGTNESSGVIRDSSSAAEVCGGGGSVAGLVGINYGTLVDCYATGNVYGQENAGGLVGYSLNGSLTRCYATGDVESNGSGFVGGLCGVLTSSTAEECFATGNVNAPLGGDVGGFSGGGWGVTLTHCFATGKVTGNGRTSAFIGGQTDGAIDSCYAAGPVSGGVTAALLAYEDGALPTFTRCYWDVNVTGQIESVTGQPETSFGISTADMTRAVTFMDWNVGAGTPFEIIERKTYPYMAWRPPQAFVTPVHATSRDTALFTIEFSIPVPGFTAQDLRVTCDGVAFDATQLTRLDPPHARKWQADIRFTGLSGKVTLQVNVNDIIVSGEAQVAIDNGPSNPGSRDITEDSITWTWTDNSMMESGFEIFAGPGDTAPDTVTYTAAANAVDWTMDSLAANAQYAFQAAAVFPEESSEKTETITAWTLALSPSAPDVWGNEWHAMYVAIKDDDGNPDWTEYGLGVIINGSTHLWIQSDGALTTSPVWQTRSAWGEVYVHGLNGGTGYTFVAHARNGAGVQTLLFPGILAYTLCKVEYLTAGNGYISGLTPQYVIHGDDGGEVLATGNTGYHFSHWSDGSVENPRIDTAVLHDAAITAFFALNKYTLTYAAGSHGHIEGPAQQTINHGADGYEVRAVPSTGYHFAQWSDGSTDNPRIDYAVQADLSVTASFASDNEGEGVPDGEGMPDGEGTADGEIPSVHSADQNGDNAISLTELLRVIQFFNMGGFHCVTPPAVSEDGYLPGAGEDYECTPHASDYNPQNWQISLTELLRLIQFFNTGGYHPCLGANTEDGYCPGPY